MSYLPEGYPTFTYEELKKLEEKIEDNIYVIWKTLIDVTPRLPSDEYRDRASKITDLLLKGYLPIVPLNFNLVRTTPEQVFLTWGVTHSLLVEKKEDTTVIEEKEIIIIYLSKHVFERPDSEFRRTLLHELTHASGLWDEYATQNFIKAVAERSEGKIATSSPELTYSYYCKLSDKKSRDTFLKKMSSLILTNENILAQFRIPPIQEIIRKKEFEEEQKEETNKEEKKAFQSSLAKFLMASIVVMALYYLFSGEEGKS
jgi:hypothetical protein